MTVKLILCGLILGVLLVSHVKAGLKEISAYGIVSRQGASPLINNSDASASTSRAMNSGSNRSIFDELPTKSVNNGTRSSQDSATKPKHIVYPQQPSKHGVVSAQAIPAEAYGESIYIIRKAKQEKRKGYNYQKPKGASFEDSKANPSAALPASPPPPPAPIQLPPIVAGPIQLPSKTPTKSSSPTDNFPNASFDDSKANPSIAPPASPPPPPAPIQLPPIVAGATLLPVKSPAKPNDSTTNFTAAPASDASFDDPKVNRLTAPPVAPPSPPAPIQLPPVIAGSTLLPSKTPAKPSGPTNDSPAAPAPDDSPVIQYILPSDPNLFAPNIHSQYPPSTVNDETRFNGVTSYLQPASGPVVDDSSANFTLQQHPPTIAGPTPLLLTTPEKPNDLTKNSSTNYALFAPNIQSHYPSPPNNGETRFNGVTSYIPPASGSVADASSADSTPPQVPLILALSTPLLLTTPEKPSGSTQNSAPSDPNLFAPNIHSHYPPSTADGGTLFHGLTSYLPPASGSVADDSSADSSLPESPPSNQYIPPAELFQFPPNIHSHYHPSPSSNNYHSNGLTSYLPPPSGPTDTL